MSETTASRDDESVAADILRGAAEIGREIGASEWHVYKQYSAGNLEGVWKDGGMLYGSRRAIRRAHDRKARTSSK